MQGCTLKAQDNLAGTGTSPLVYDRGPSTSFTSGVINRLDTKGNSWPSSHLIDETPESVFHAASTMSRGQMAQVDTLSSKSMAQEALQQRPLRTANMPSMQGIHQVLGCMWKAVTYVWGPTNGSLEG